MNKKLQLWIDNFLYRFGYRPILECHRERILLRQEYERKISDVENKNLDRLVQSIRMVDMVKTRLITPFNSFKDVDAGNVSKEISYETIYPSQSNWYKFQVNIDFSKLQRIYQELDLSQNSYEYEYLKRSILHDIETNIDALMKVGIR